MASDSFSFLLLLGAVSVYGFDLRLPAFTAAAFSFQSAYAGSCIPCLPRLWYAALQQAWTPALALC